MYQDEDAHHYCDHGRVRATAFVDRPALWISPGTAHLRLRRGSGRRGPSPSVGAQFQNLVSKRRRPLELQFLGGIKHLGFKIA